MTLKFLCTTLPALLVGCSTPPEITALNGIWASDGYGTLAIIDDGYVHSYGLAGGTCVNEDGGQLQDFLDGFSIQRTTDGQSLLLRMEDVAHPERFNRLATIPAPCINGTPDTPFGNFDTFVDTFAAHYAFFDLYGVDWSSRAALARTQVTTETSDADLFNILSRLAAPLRDGHISLSARIDGTRFFFDPNPGQTSARLITSARAAGIDPEDAMNAFQTAYWIDGVKNTILDGQGEIAGNNFVQYGLAHPDVGYIALVTAAGFARGTEDYPQEDLIEINAILDDAMTLFASAGVSTIILDLSVNLGGYDHISMAVASRFTDRVRPAFSKFAADAVMPIITQQDVVPTNRPSFDGPVYVMTSDVTVSAGEILTLAMRALPHVTHIGQPTRGAFSNVLEKQLPNGWEFGLSNEVYTDFRGERWEGRGITPEIALEVFPEANPTAGHSAAVQQVIELATSGRQ